MKTLKWNLGIFIIRIGYNIRGRKADANDKSHWLKWHIGKWILKQGYNLRGNIPQKRLKWNHV